MIVNAKKNGKSDVKDAQNGINGAHFVDHTTDGTTNAKHATVRPRGTKRKVQKPLTFYSMMTIYVLLRFLASDCSSFTSCSCSFTRTRCRLCRLTSLVYSALCFVC